MATTGIQHSDTSERTLARSDYAVMELDSMARRSGERFKENFEEGFYCCAHCGARLLSSTEKFKSTGRYPAFRRPIARSYLKLNEDYSYGTPRKTVSCAHCGLYLGMELNTVVDGEPTKYYGILSITVEFEPRANAGDAPTYIEEEESDEEEVPIAQPNVSAPVSAAPTPEQAPQQAPEQPKPRTTQPPQPKVQSDEQPSPAITPQTPTTRKTKPASPESAGTTVLKYVHIALVAAPLLAGLYQKYRGQNPSS